MSLVFVNEFALILKSLDPQQGLKPGNKTKTRRLTMKFFTKLLRDEQGATAIEYGLIAALIAVAAITAMQSLGSNLTNTFNKVSTNLTTTSA